MFALHFWPSFITGLGDVVKLVVTSALEGSTFAYEASCPDYVEK